MKEVKRNKVPPCFMNKGDEVRVTYTDDDKKEHRLATHLIDKSVVIDTVIIFKLEDGDFNLEAGYCAVIGKGK